ncbi:MAG: hypothetical protein AB7E29_12395 [Xanthobacter sp.]
MPQQGRVMDFTGPQPVSEGEIDAVLEACAGDARASIRALLIGQAFLQQELVRIKARVSNGYCRGKGPERRG